MMTDHDDYEDKQELLLEAATQAYLKHHCGYDFIGWEELSDLLYDALINVCGHTKFRSILSEQIRKHKELNK